ncbi:MAG: PLD nuclease N-terminal domain-containing protein [Tepidisphaeraceae bacterium]
MISATLATVSILAQQSTGGGAGFAIGGVMMLLFIVIGLAATVFWIWMLVDALTSSMPSTEKLIWVLVIFFLHLLGALIYFFVGRGGRSAVA